MTIHRNSFDPETPAGAGTRGRFSSSLIALWCRAGRIIRAIDDSLIGDVIGGVCLFLTMILFTIAFGVLQ